MIVVQFTDLKPPRPAGTRLVALQRPDGGTRWALLGGGDSARQDRVAADLQAAYGRSQPAAAPCRHSPMAA